jgi:hypothetical protein
MDTTTIYRIEHKDNHRGPWWCGIGEVADAANASVYGCNTSHPIPQEDYMLDHNGDAVRYGVKSDRLCVDNWQCGAENLNHMVHWFNEASIIATFAENGMELVKLTVPSEHVFIGETQVLFDPYHILNREVLDIWKLVV